MKSALLVPLFFLLSFAAMQKVEGSVDSLIDDGPKNKSKVEGAVIPKKCGEGEDKGIHKCVPYYMCNGGLVLSGDDAIVDIRFHDDGISCDDYLIVCCKMSDVIENQ